MSEFHTGLTQRVAAERNIGISLHNRKVLSGRKVELILSLLPPNSSRQMARNISIVIGFSRQCGAGFSMSGESQQPKKHESHGKIGKQLCKSPATG
jgi:hypothetical protein